MYYWGMNTFKEYLGLFNLLVVIVYLLLILFTKKKMTNNEVFGTLVCLIIGLNMLE